MNSEDVKKRTMDAVNSATECVNNYVNTIYERHVFPAETALDSLSNFDEGLPQLSSNASTVIRQLHQFAAPATVATTGGRYFGLVVGGVTPASMGAAMLNAAWDQIAILEAASPAAIYLERIAAKWVLELLALPADSSVGFTTGTSVGNLVCLAAARNAQYEKLGVHLDEVGLAGAPPLRVIVSEQAHVTVYKALGLLGFGKNQIIKILCDKEGRILPDALPHIGKDTIICLQTGNVNSGASDYFEQIIPQANAAGAWVHVDGAFGLWASASAHKKHLLVGVEHADSWATDGHKWLNTPYDCGMAICRNPQAVHNVMTTIAPYLTEDTEMPPKDMVPEFSRRARGIEVWAAIKEMGSSGVADLIDRCCLHAEKLSKGLKEIGYTILNEVQLNQVVATIGNAEQLQEILSLVQEDGECWFGSTYWQEQYAIRLSVSSWATTDEDIKRTLNAIEKATNKIISG
ncbi:MAG: pyridoxal-dependent decarboxylase [Sedimenticola sp.]